MNSQDENSTSKIFLERRIFMYNSDSPITWKDMKHVEFHDDDIVRCEFVEGFYSENNSWDPHFSFEVTRMIEETDDQFAKRQEQIETSKKFAKKRRMELYEKLKNEFENNKEEK